MGLIFGHKSCLGRIFGFIGSLMLFAVVVVALSNLYVVLSTKSSIVGKTEAQSFGADAIVVLGASVYADGTPSSILKDRLDCGIELYNSGAAAKLIMSGDNGTASYNEVNAMKAYAINQGVPSEDIFCDHAGFNTYDSMYRAQNVFGCKKIIVATQTYHLYRALSSSHLLGVQAVGVPSDYRSYQKQFFYDLREIPARTKDVVRALFRMPSTYVGNSVNLNQSGDVTN